VEHELAYLKVRVTPGARQDALAGWRQDVLRVKVRAAPEHGKANDGLCKFIARQLGLSAAMVTVAKGSASREKLLFIEGMTDEGVRARLGL
jgi:uncharacterized protein (TIGR00251 family)